METIRDTSGWGQVARIREIVDEHRLYIEMPNGSLGWADISDTAEFFVGQVILIFNDHLESAPEGLWHEDPFISVVRIKNSDTTVLEFAGPPRSAEDERRTL